MVARSLVLVAVLTMVGKIVARLAKFLSRLQDGWRGFCKARKTFIVAARCIVLIAVLAIVSKIFAMLPRFL